MSAVYLLLGSNLGDREHMLRSALLHIQQQIGKIVLKSSIYETEPWGFFDEKYFLNQVIASETSLIPNEVLRTLLLIEHAHGRTRSGNQFTSRTIDIDILFYDNLVMHENDLVIPHPDLHKRMFTLIPLAEVSPDFIHPVYKKPVSMLLNECDDPLKVHKFG